MSEKALEETIEMSTKAEAQEKGSPATLQVGGDDVKVEIPETQGVDIHERDPHNMNAHVKVKFQEIIGEPDPEVFSFDKVWIASHAVFTGTKLWCYRLSSLFCAVPVSLCWGVYFACLSFCTVWCCIPCLRCYEIELNCIRRFWEVCINTFCGPFFDVIARCFSNISLRVKMSKE